MISCIYRKDKQEIKLKLQEISRVLNISCREKIGIFILFSKRMYIEKNNSHAGHKKIKSKIKKLVYMDGAIVRS